MTTIRKSAASLLIALSILTPAAGFLSAFPGLLQTASAQTQFEILTVDPKVYKDTTLLTDPIIIKDATLLPPLNNTTTTADTSTQSTATTDTTAITPDNGLAQNNPLLPENTLTTNPIEDIKPIEPAITETQTTDTGRTDTINPDTSTSETAVDETTTQTSATRGDTDTGANFVDLSRFVEMDTITINPRTEQQTEETKCPIQTTDPGQCITTDNAVEAASPGIINNQTKIAIIVLVTTMIGLVISMVTIYLLNNQSSRREIERLQKNGANFSKDQSRESLRNNYTHLTEELGTLIATLDNGNQLKKSALTGLITALSNLQLTASPETAKKAGNLIDSLHNETKAPESQKQAITDLLETIKQDLNP